MAFRYSQEQIAYLIKIYKGKSNIELAEILNGKFGLSINNSSISNLKSKLRRQGYVLEKSRNDGCFKKGNISHNKGLKWKNFMSEEGMKNSMKTTFKKNNLSANALPIGTESNRKGYVYIKVKDGNNNKNWKPKQRIIYEQHYGKIPDGYKIIFADGNNRNFEIDNLIMVTNNEEMVMNRYDLRSTDKEITKTGSLIAKVMVKTNEVSKRL